MTSSKKLLCGAAILGALAAVVLCPAARAFGQEPAANRILPRDAFLLVEVRNVDSLIAKFKQTGVYGLYKEPAMQRFLAPAEKKVRELIDEAIQKAWKELKLADPPKDIPWPKGRVILGLRMAAKTIQVPEYDWDEKAGEMKVRGMREKKVWEPRPVILADMGENLQAARKLIDKLIVASVDKGYKRETQTLRGVEVTVLTPPTPKKADSPTAPSPPKPDPVCIGFQGSTLIIGEMALMKDVLVRMAGGDLPCFGDDDAYKSTLRALSPGSDVLLYLDVKNLVKNLREQQDSQEGKEEFDKNLRVLGLDNVTAVGAVAQVAPNPNEDLRVQALVSIRGEPAGVPAILTPVTTSTRKPHRLLTRDLAGFVVANYDVGKMFDGIARIAKAMSGVDLNMQLQMMVAMGTGGQEEGAPPPVNFRQDILGQLAPPLSVVLSFRKPYTAPNSTQGGLAIGVRDGAVLDAALGRIHDAFVARNDKTLRKELLKTNIYILPVDPTAVLGQLLPFGGRRDEPEESPKFGFAVVGGNLLMAPVPVIEQEIRSVKRDKAPEGIQLDPMYRHASRVLPAEAGVYFYFNNQIQNQVEWERIKAAAKQWKEQAARGEGPTTTRPGGMSPSGIVIETLRAKLGDSVDFTDQPDF
ncbi:MAG TPA: hypothetical protein VMZ50_05000, partial [Phycisphaerae bacterium]|nr:hypothetical protein [Phycisphaerae bacterium]